MSYLPIILEMTHYHYANSDPHNLPPISIEFITEIPILFINLLRNASYKNSKSIINLQNVNNPNYPMNVILHAKNNCNLYNSLIIIYITYVCYK